jgi:hypothetical protein
MHSEAVIERVWRCTLAGNNRARLAEYLEIDLEAVDREGGAMGAETLFIDLLVIVEMKRVEYKTSRREMRKWLGGGDSRFWDDAVLGVCCCQ